LKQLLAEADTDGSGGISYREYLVVILKEKKGLYKGKGDIFGGFVAVMAKKHDESKETGKKANVFEQKATDMQNSVLKEQDLKRQQELKKQQIEAKRKLMAEEKIKQEKEEERKKKLAENLAKFKSGINNG